MFRVKVSARIRVRVPYLTRLTLCYFPTMGFHLVIPSLTSSELSELFNR